MKKIIIITGSKLWLYLKYNLEYKFDANAGNK